MDRAILVAINGLRAGWLDALMGPLSSWGIYLFPLAMLLGLLRADRGAAARSVRDGWLTWFLATFLSESVLKPLAHRPRPTADASLRAALHVLGTVPSEGSLSFPSGTAAAAFAGATWIALRWGRRSGAEALALAALVSFSRVYAGVHWPTDIVGGALVGAACAIGCDRVARRIERLPSS